MITEYHYAIHKAVKVIRSCRNFGQLELGRRYISLVTAALFRLDRSVGLSRGEFKFYNEQISDLYKLMDVKTKELMGIYDS